MNERIEKGIRKTGNTYGVSIDLPGRADRKEKSYSFHLGTVKTLEEARELRKKAIDIKAEYEDINDCLYFLNELKEQVKRKNINKSQAIDILEAMLFEHEFNAAHIDFSSTNEYEVEKQIAWEERKQALEMAVKMLKTNKTIRRN